MKRALHIIFDVAITIFILFLTKLIMGYVPTATNHFAIYWTVALLGVFTYGVYLGVTDFWACSGTKWLPGARGGP